MEEDQEGSPIIVDPNDEPMTDDNFILSDGATPAQDEPEAGISQMDSADIETELNNLLPIDSLGGGSISSFGGGSFFKPRNSSHIVHP